MPRAAGWPKSCGTTFPASSLRSRYRRPWAARSSPGRRCAPCARTCWPSAMAAISPARKSSWKSRKRAKRRCASWATCRFPARPSPPYSSWIRTNNRISQNSAKHSKRPPAPWASGAFCFCYSLCISRAIWASRAAPRHRISSGAVKWQLWSGHASSPGRAVPSQAKAPGFSVR